MSTNFDKNSSLNFVNTEKIKKKNIDFFDLKEQRAEEN